MQIDRVIAAVLATPVLGLVACPGQVDCEPFILVDEDFADTFDVDLGDVKKLVEDSSAVITTCEELCRGAFLRNDWRTLFVYSFDVSSCSTDIALPLVYDPDAATPDTSDTYLSNDLVGTVTCAGHIVAAEEDLCKGGRRPLRWRDRPTAGPTRRARQLAAMATLEAAAALAFDELAVQITALGAPEELIARCRMAAGEEQVHARLTGRLARREGARPRRARGRPAPADLRAMALHNAVEGCVNECWAALEATVQAQHGPEDLRALHRLIAADETRHGQLAWDLHRWMLPQLCPEDRAAVEAAQAAALRRLHRTVARRPDPLGRPAGAAGRRLARSFAREILDAASVYTSPHAAER